MSKEIILITDYLGYLRQDVKVLSSIKINVLVSIFQKEGFDVRVLTFDEIANNNIEIANKYIVYSSSQQLDYKNYIDDILYTLSKKNELVPKYEIFKAHENKGYQELLKREKSISSLNYYYFSNDIDIKNHKDLIKFPIIFKNVRGSTSIGVYKINSYAELLKVIKKEKKVKFTLKKNVKRLLKKTMKHDLESRYLGRFILQEFVPNLSDDWKVLIFNDKYYVLNRKVRSGDFRASGSGLISYIDPPSGMLDFAKKIFEQLDVPFISLDICFDGKEFYLIEYQGVHMGPITLVNSNYYFIKKNGNWEKVSGQSELSNEYGYSIVNYLNRKKIN